MTLGPTLQELVFGRGISDILCKYHPWGDAANFCRIFLCPSFMPSHPTFPLLCFPKIHMKFKCSVDCINEYILGSISFFLKNISLLIWLHRILVTACGIFLVVA